MIIAIDIACSISSIRMRSGFYTYLLLLVGFFLLNGATTDGTKIKPSGGCATITSEEKTICKLESERSLAERTWCKQLKRFGRMNIV